jgi:probable HAF family extracellular repeat protein
MNLCLAFPRRPLVAALGLALAALCQPVAAAPAAAQWTVTGLGTLGGSQSSGRGINNAGQVTGDSGTAGNLAEHAFFYSNGSLTSLGTFGGSYSFGYGINSAGQVTGLAYAAGNSTSSAFVYSSSTLGALGTLGGSWSEGYGINNAGQVTGSSYTTGNGVSHAFLYSNGAMTDLGTLGSPIASSAGLGINNAGQIVGWTHTASAATRAFLYRSGAMSELGTLGGTHSEGYGINDAGQVVGWSGTAGDASVRAFLYSNGAMTSLGALSGANDSMAYGINQAGQVVGWSNPVNSSIGSRAFLHTQGTMHDVNSFNGVAGSGWMLTDARGINDVGQIVGSGYAPGDSNAQAFVLTLDTTVWESGFGGSWDHTGNWSYGIAPNKNASVVTDPTRSLTVFGPAGNVEVKRLSVGSGNGGGGGIATLVLDGGKISVAGDSGGTWQGVTVEPTGVLTGDGVLSVNTVLIGGVHNYGTIVADNVRVQSTGNLINAQVLNHGLITGNTSGPARLVSGTMQNDIDGRIRVLSGERLTLDAAVVNYGSVEVLGGQFTHRGGTFDGTSRVNQRGRIVAQNALLTFERGLTLGGGQLNVSAGNNNVFGAVTVQRSLTDNQGGQIILSGNSQTAFYDNVEVQSGGELRVSKGSVGTFFGQVLQRTGALFTGAGTKFYEGGLSIGNSPGLGSDGGDVSFGAGNIYRAEIGGTALGDEQGNGIAFDRYVVAGTLTLGGTLDLVSWNGYVGQAGDRFDLFDWGSLNGSFDAIDDSGFMLADGMRLDLSRLYVDGSLGVTAVPEPHTHALMLGGLGLLLAWTRRRARPGRAPGGR